MQTIASLPATATLPWIGRLGRPRLLLGAAALGLIAAAMAWQWSWLVAAGVAPLLLSIAPCAAMCGLGLCMHRIGGRTCNSVPVDPDTRRETLDAPATTQEI